jgi:hypothetical protein
MPSTMKTRTEKSSSGTRDGERDTIPSNESAVSPLVESLRTHLSKWYATPLRGARLNEKDARLLNVVLEGECFCG